MFILQLECGVNKNAPISFFFLDSIMNFAIHTSYLATSSLLDRFQNTSFGFALRNLAYGLSDNEYIQL